MPTVKVLLATIMLLVWYPINASESLVVSNDANGSYIIRNGRLGIVVPSEKSISKNKNPLAPLQSFILSDGKYTDRTPNYLETGSAPIRTSITLKKLSNSIIYAVRYSFNKPTFPGNYKNASAGPGFYSCTITILSNSNTITIEEDSDYDVVYEVDISQERSFNQARYRGWSSTSPELGYEPGGTQYRDENNRHIPLDATVDFTYKNKITYPFLSNWDPAGAEVNTGRYWQFYNKNANATSNMMGIFQGKPSRLIGNRFIGIKPVENSGERGTLSLRMEITRRGPDNSWFPRKRFQWCAYISRKKEVFPPGQYQTIGTEMNRVSGVASKIEAYSTKPLVLNPAFMKGSIYMDEQSITRMIKGVKTDEAYYKKLWKVNPSFYPILAAWRFKDSAQSLKKEMLRVYHDLKWQLVNGDGTHTFNFKYWMGSIYYKRCAMQITALLADPGKSITESEIKQLMEFMRLMARLQWDDDYVPFFDSSGINFGTANMNYQYRNNGRNFFALLFANDPEFSARAAKVLEETRNDLLSAIGANGISFASPHYTQATIDPILYNMLQLKQSGIGDLFNEQKERLFKFIAFYSSLLTPPSVRFNNYRKLVNLGDGSEESAPTFALLAAGFKSFEPALSQQLYYYFENGAPRQSLFGETGLAIDMDKHDGKFTGGSANFVGYLSHARTGVNTPIESASWIINGETYSDHRNDDRGETVIYALGAPLSLSRNSFYSPYAPDARIRSLLIPEKLFPAWSGNDQPINGEDKNGNPWSNAEVTSYCKFKYSTISVSRIQKDKTDWFRTFSLIHSIPEEPFFLYYDSTNLLSPSIWSMPFMSDEIKDERGQLIRPLSQLHDNNTKRELPSGLSKKELRPGWNQFQFTGQRWNKHVSGGINWNLYIHTGGKSDFSVSQWTNFWQNTQELEEFQFTNGSPYKETQQILRWRSSQPFLALITPALKNDTSHLFRALVRSSNRLEGRTSAGKYVLTPGYLDIRMTSGKRVITAITDKSIAIDDVRISGGPVEVEIEGKTIAIRIAGNSGERKIEFPFELVPDKNVNMINSKGKCILTIKHVSEGMDVGPADSGFIEYIVKSK